jgi:hypothetical protein
MEKGCTDYQAQLNDKIMQPWIFKADDFEGYLSPIIEQKTISKK